MSAYLYELAIISPSNSWELPWDCVDYS